MKMLEWSAIIAADAAVWFAIVKWLFPLVTNAFNAVLVAF